MSVRLFRRELLLWLGFLKVEEMGVSLRHGLVIMLSSVLLFTTTFIIHCFGAAWQDGLFSTSHRQIFQICLTDKK